MLLVAVLCMGVSIAVAHATNEPFESPMPTVTPAPFVTPAPPVASVSHAVAVPTATPEIIPTPVPPELCSHPYGFNVNERFTYSFVDAQYHNKNTYVQRTCITCGYAYPESLINTQKYEHPQYLMKWRDSHISANKQHQFVQYCGLCYGTIQSCKVPCIGNPHVSNPLQ